MAERSCPTEHAGSLLSTEALSNSTLEQAQWYHSKTQIGSSTFLMSRWFRIVYCAYLLAFIMLGAVALCCSTSMLQFIDGLFLSVSVVTMTGLSPVQFASLPATTHVVVWVLMLAASPLLLTLLPVVLRKRAFRKQAGFLQQEVLRRSASLGSNTTNTTSVNLQESDEYVALGLIIEYVLIYFFAVQLLGFGALWAIFARSNVPTGAPAWAHAAFVSSSAFSNAGLMTLSLPHFTSQNSTSTFAVLSALVLLGNTFFPAALRLMVWAIRRPLPCLCCRDREQFCRARRLLLDDPRRCYTHLFPNAATQALVAVLFVLYLLQFGVFVATEVAVQDSPAMADMAWGQRLLAAHFTVICTRCAGLTTLNLHKLSAASCFTLCVAMWISASPVVVTMRSTSTENRCAKESRQSYDLAEPSLDAAQRRRSERYERPQKVRDQLSRFMSEHSGILVLLFCAILISESYRLDELDKTRMQQRANFLEVLFEFCSSWGNVGMSMGRERSESGCWHPSAKLCLMIVMFLGNLRGLPDSIDPSVSLCLADLMPMQEGQHENQTRDCEAAFARTAPSFASSLPADGQDLESFHSALSHA